jgi:glutamate racemase
MMKAFSCSLALVFALAMSVALADEAAKPVGTLMPLFDHVSAHRDGKAPHSIDFAALKGDRSQLPIGVFDSGIGGLTVLEAILKLDAFNNVTLQPGADGVPDFAGEKFIYFGDQANMPYGNYPSKGKEDFLRELIVNDAVFLLGKRYHSEKGPKFDKPAVKAIVIACNTATAYGIEDIRAALKTWGLEVPVIGVVEAGARAVVEQLPKNGKAPTVGVLATVGTCSSNAYPKAIARMAGLAGKPVPLVVQQGSIGLAGAIEGNPAYVWNAKGERPVPYAGPDGALGGSLPSTFPRLKAEDFYTTIRPAASQSEDTVLHPDLRPNSVPAYASFDAGELMSSLGNLVPPLPMRYVVLGCTHFPLAETELKQAFEDAREYTDPQGEKPYARAIEEQIVFINPAEYTAKDLFRELARARLRNKSDITKLIAPAAEFFLSVANPNAVGVRLAPDGSLDTSYKEGREPGHADREDTKVIRMTPETLPASSGALVAKLPTVWQQLQGAPKAETAGK